jgi:hypothetical protein
MWEFSQNILLDQKHRGNNSTMHEINMSIKSIKFPEYPVFHTVDPTAGLLMALHITFSFLVKYG